jgi:hypothetical protein
MKKNNQGGKPVEPSTGEPGYPFENQPSKQQLIPEKGEEYLREVANIEDMPSPAEDKEAEDILREEDKRDQLKI